MVRGLVVAAVLLATLVGEADAARDDTAWLQAKLDAGGTLVLPKLPNGECYATRGLWLSRDDTKIVSDGACIVGTGPGEVRTKSPDGDPIPAEAVFYISRTSPFSPAPARISISGLRLDVPASSNLYGISILGHLVSVRNVEVTGAPVDALYIGGRGNDNYAARVSVTDSRFLAGRRNVVSIVGAIGVEFARNVVSGGTDTYEVAPGRAWGNPAAGIDIEPGGRGTPILDVRIADNEIVENAGPGILVVCTNYQGLPVLADGIDILRNRILRNGTRATPPQHGGIVFNGGQDEGGGHVLVEANEIAGNRYAALSVRWDVNFEIEQRNNRIAGAVRVQRLRPE